VSEAEEIARGCEAEATWLERQCFDDTAANLRALAARVRRLSAPAAGWTEVTDDPATWPPDSNERIIFEYLDGSYGIDRHAYYRRGRAQHDHADASMRFRWMPWPTSAPAAPVDVEHGRTCPKVAHSDPEGGYLHDDNDDSPYGVDGVDYCGRCHRVLRAALARKEEP